MSAQAKTMLSIYDEPISEQESPSSTTDESPDEMTLHPSVDASIVPYIGQQFVTHDSAYEFYSQFAKRCGFSIRRHRTEGKDGVGKGLMRRYFVCHRAGNTPSKQPSEFPSLLWYDQYCSGSGYSSCFYY
jgi:FAR1 DNA-binding domain